MMTVRHTWSAKANCVANSRTIVKGSTGKKPLQESNHPEKLFEDVPRKPRETFQILITRTDLHVQHNGRADESKLNGS
jgi:hypothetical protein